MTDYKIIDGIKVFNSREAAELNNQNEMIKDLVAELHSCQQSAIIVGLLLVVVSLLLISTFFIDK